jgi:hypothetical protein
MSARTTAPRPAPRRTPTTRHSPARNRLSPQHAPSSSHSRRSQALTHSAAARRCTQRTLEALEVQRRQLRHPSENRCQRRCPICSEVIVCTHRRPSARPSQNPTRPLQPHVQAPQPKTRSIIQCTAGVRKQSLTAQLPADARSVRLRSSAVSCVILPRLDASDAAPAAPMSLPARTAAHSARPSQNPNHPLQPHAQLPQPHTAPVFNHA